MEQKGIGKEMVKLVSVMWDARRSTASKPFCTAVNVRAQFRCACTLSLWAGKLSRAGTSADNWEPGTEAAKCRQRLRHAAPCSCGTGLLLMHAAGKPKSQLLSNRGHMETLSPPALLHPQLYSAGKPALKQAQSGTTGGAKESLGRQGAQVKLLKRFFHRLKGRHLWPALRLTGACGEIGRVGVEG